MSNRAGDVLSEELGKKLGREPTFDEYTRVVGELPEWFGMKEIREAVERVVG